MVDTALVLGYNTLAWFFIRRNGGANDEANLSTEKTATQKSTRLPCPDVESRWKTSIGKTKKKRT